MTINNDFSELWEIRNRSLESLKKVCEILDKRVETNKKKNKKLWQYK
jgi:hypothetical protein